MFKHFKYGLRIKNKAKFEKLKIDFDKDLDNE